MTQQQIDLYKEKERVLDCLYELNRIISGSTELWKFWKKGFAFKRPSENEYVWLTGLDQKTHNEIVSAITDITARRIKEVKKEIEEL